MLELWIVVNGEAFRLHEATEDDDGVRLAGRDERRLWRADFGVSWVIVLAASAAEARAFAERRHPAQPALERFAVAYRGGGVSLSRDQDRRA
jgi:hypothetical protein